MNFLFLSLKLPNKKSKNIIKLFFFHSFPFHKLSKDTLMLKSKHFWNQINQVTPLKDDIPWSIELASMFL